MKADITRKVRFVAALIIIVFFSSTHAAIWYVDSTAPSPGSGTSWESPFNSIQAAINAANGFIPQCNSPDQIWVKEGTFMLSSELNMYKHVSLYGGFPSAGSPTMGDRDPDAYPTIISGAWGIVRLMTMSAISHIYGFTFQRGYAELAGAIYIDDVPPVDCGLGLVVRVTIKNCQFIDNTASTSVGGAIYDYKSSPLIQDCGFYGNESPNGGGAIRLWDSAAIIKSCIFANNSASPNGYGGAIYGGASTGGGATAPSGSVSNCLFYGNTAAFGGALHLFFNHRIVNVTNCTFANNSAHPTLGDGGAIGTIDSTVIITNSIFRGGIPNEVTDISFIHLSFSNIQGGWSGFGANNSDVDPLFAGSGDYHLTLGSPCVDSASNDFAPSDDLEGSSRPYDGDGDGTATADKGAYELDDVVSTPVGTNVGVSIGDVSVTYETVNGAGNTHVSESGTGPGVPADHQVSCMPPRYYDISTTATYSGTIEICIQYDPASCDESDLHLFHYEGGVWVDVTTSVDTVANIICGEVASLSDFLLAGPTPAGLGCSDNDVHTATTENIFNNWTVIDNPLTNGNPDAIVFATQNWNPGGGNGTYNDAAIGVWYDGTKWAIFNQDIIPMPEGAAFNFKVVPLSESVFVHTATAANIGPDLLDMDETRIDHPLTNGNPDALLFVTQNWEPGTVIGVGTYNDSPIGVKYNGTEWVIVNQNENHMPIGADFNVKVVLPSESAIVHTATGGNTGGHITDINHPMANGNPDAIVLVTLNMTPGGGTEQYNDHSIGVYYNGTKWSIFNQDFSSMALGTDFNVTIVPTTSDNFVHINTPASGGNTARIDNTLTNGNLDALLFVTQNWNPGNSVGTYNDSSIGVWYSKSVSKWGVFNQDLDLMPENASFNVKVAAASDSTFVHTATISNSLDAATLISHPLTDGHPEVLIFVTQNWNPGGSGGIYNNSPMLVSWDGVAQLWSIYNENNTVMTRGAAFNIMVVMPSESAFIHTATVGNIGGGSNHSTFIDHPMTNGNPNTRLLVTRNQEVGAGHAVNNSPVAVWYNGIYDRWEIFNQNITAISSGATFNVMVLTECEMSCVPCTCDEVDFNGDGIVNLEDSARLAEAWLEHELLVDLAPPSSIVDAADLEEFTRHWLESCD